MWRNRLRLFAEVQSLLRLARLPIEHRQLKERGYISRIQRRGAEPQRFSPGLILMSAIVSRSRVATLGNLLAEKQQVIIVVDPLLVFIAVLASQANEPLAVNFGLLRQIEPSVEDEELIAGWGMAWVDFQRRLIVLLGGIELPQLRQCRAEQVVDLYIAGPPLERLMEFFQRLS